MSKLTALAAVIVLSGAVVAGCAPDAAEEEVLTGEGTGYSDDVPIQVEVTRVGDEITDIEVLQHDESEDVGAPVLEDLVETMLEEQSAGVEAVSGATETSEGLMEAVADALGE